MKSIHAIWIIARHDLLMWRRMPLAITTALIPPIGMMLILVTLSLAVLQQPVALVNQASGKEALRMQKIIQSDTDAYVNYDFSNHLKTIDEKTARNYLDEQLIAAIIIIPKDFDSKIKNGKANVHLVLNNVDIDFADDIRRSVNRSVAHFDAPILSPDDAEENGKEYDPEASNPYLMSINEEDLRETNVEWLQYQVLPTLILLVLSVGLIGTALLCGQDIERKTARLLLLSPYNAWILVAGRLFSGVIASIIALIPAIFLCMITGIINPPTNHLPALLAIFLATAICASGFGAIIGSFLRGARTIAMASSVVATYMFFLGGGFTTIVFLPDWLQTISAFIPMRYAIDGMRQALFYSSMDGITKDIAILSLTGLCAIVIGSYTIRRSWGR
jgi:ABC-type transport system involved in multi-copper enzyme maturation permease subunit